MAINEKNVVALTTWESLRIGGRLVIATICSAIDKSDLIIADITSLNPNVMFELGYAIARKKRVWLILDPTYSTPEFKQFRTLTPVGYQPYTNSDDIVSRFLADRPYLDTELVNTLFHDQIEENLPIPETHIALYVRSKVRNQSGLQLDALLAREGDVIIDDPDEGGAKSLTWYGHQVWKSRAVLCHLTDPKRKDSSLDNARQSLVAGLASGFERRVLIEVEGDVLAPLDYQNISHAYRTASECIGNVVPWLDAARSAAKDAQTSAGHVGALMLKSDLQSLDFGDYVAENEEDGLIHKYFVGTRAYTQALRGDNAIFVGRKGAGKTANLLKLRAELTTDRRNLVAVIKPVSYDLLISAQ